MNVQPGTETAITMTGGLLLLIHGIHGAVDAIAYFGTPAVHAVHAAGAGFASGEAAGYAAGLAFGHVFWPLASLCVGGALLWLAARKRARRARAMPAA